MTSFAGFFFYVFKRANAKILHTYAYLLHSLNELKNYFLSYVVGIHSLLYSLSFVYLVLHNLKIILNKGLGLARPWARVHIIITCCSKTNLVDVWPD